MFSERDKFKFKNQISKVSLKPTDKISWKSMIFESEKEIPWKFLVVNTPSL